MNNNSGRGSQGNHKKSSHGGRTQTQSRGPRDEKLSMNSMSRNPSDFSNNFYPWFRRWEVKVGTYSERIKKRFQAGASEKYDLGGNKARYPIIPLLSVDPRVFQLTDEQVDVLETMAATNGISEFRLSNKKAEYLDEWIKLRTEENAIIRSDNIINEKLLDECVVEERKSKDEAVKLISDILESMSIESQKLCMEYVVPEIRNERGEMTVPAYTFANAVEERDWFFLFDAARETHVRKLSKRDETALRQRQEGELTALKTMYHKAGLFTSWIQRFEDQIDRLESTGYTISNTDKKMYFMDNLNKLIFETTCANWNNSMLRGNFPHEFSALKTQVIDDYELVRLKNPQVVARVERGERTEVSYPATPTKCEICGDKHKTDDCQWRNANYSVKSNKIYMERRKSQGDVKDSGKKTAHTDGATKASGKSETKTEPPEEDGESSESKWNPTKGTIVQKPNKKKEKSNRVTQLSYTEQEMEIRTVTVESELNKSYEVIEDRSQLHHPSKLSEFACRTSARSLSQYTFIYDTGSVTGAVTPEYSNAIEGVYEDFCEIQGQGGGQQFTELAGNNTFGMFRQMKTSNGNMNLISHREAEKCWQLVHLRPGYMQLRELPHCKQTGKIWHIYSDENIYGGLPLLTVSREELPELFAYVRNYYERQNSFWRPKDIVNEDELTAEEILTLNKMDKLHLIYGHASAGAMRRLSENLSKSDHTQRISGFSTAEVGLWGKYRAHHCSGCAQGKMTMHSQKKSSSKMKFNIGQVISGDIIFVDGMKGKIPFAVYQCPTSLYTMVHKLTDKSADSLYKSVILAKKVWTKHGHQPTIFIYDREPAIESIQWEIQELGMEPKLKAAGQHVAKVEVSNRYIREMVRSTKAGVYDLFGFKAPTQWNIFIIHDAVDTLNRRLPIGFVESPYKLFTGCDVDYQRDFRIAWGHPVVVKRSKRTSADMTVEGLWGVPVRRYMNSTGVILFYIVETKSYRHAIKFEYAKIPAWVIPVLQDIPEDQPINFDLDDEGPPNFSSGPTDDDVASDVDDVVNTQIIDALDKVDGSDRDVDIDQEREEIRDAYLDDVADMDIPQFVYAPEQGEERIIQHVPSLRGARRELEGLRSSLGPYFQPTLRAPDNAEGPRRSQRERTQRKQYNIERFNIFLEKHFSLFEKALNSDRRDAALKALDKELDSAEEMKIWDPILEEDLSSEQRKLIIDTMANFVEKYLPTGGFDKYKVRVLARGDQQTEFGETSSPVCRVESVFLIAIIAANLDLEVFKIDIVSAYLNTKMKDDIIHQWLLLPRHVAKRLVERNANRYSKFLRKDGKILVHMNALTYGYKEAAYGWFLTFGEMFDEAGYLRMPKDVCFLYKLGKRIGDIFLAAVCVDDVFGAATRDSGLKEEFYASVDKRFKFTKQEGDELDCIGMHFKFDRVNKAVSVTQEQFVSKLVTNYGVTRKAKTPALSNLFEEDPESPLLKDQLSFLALNSSCSFAGTRTYPELLPCTSTLASRYYKATEQDWARGIRMIEYMHGAQDHALYLRPRSLRVVGYADASYAERTSGHSQTGGCIGVEGHDTPCLFIFLSGRQPVIAKSSCEAELIAANTVGDYFVWLHECLSCVSLRDTEPGILYQDNKATIQITEKGAGSFKRTKHIRVRFFWISELVKLGEMVLSFLPSGEMVADIMTKPVVGNLFRYLRDKLLGTANGSGVMPEGEVKSLGEGK